MAMVRSCEMSVRDQLDRIRQLEDGWLDGDGTSYSALHLHCAEVALTGIALSAEWVPYVYPDVEGAIRAEFDDGSNRMVAVLEIWPGDGRMSLSTDDDEWWAVDVEFAAEELRRIGHAN